MKTRRLDEAEFKATMAPKMCDVTKTADEVVDIWPYVEAVSSADYEGHSLLDAELVYRSGENRFEHVLVATGTKNVYLVVVVVLAQRAIYGHRLLDLNRQAGEREVGPDMQQWSDLIGGSASARLDCGRHLNSPPKEYSTKGQVID